MNKIAAQIGIALVATLGLSAAQAANTTITNGSITAVINDAGTFAGHSSGEPTPVPQGMQSLSYNGVEYLNWGDPASWYWLKAGGDTIAMHGSNPLHGTTVGGGGFSISFAFGSLSLVQTFSLPMANKLTVTVSITNNGSSALSGVQWGVGFDPDQGKTGISTGTHATLNRIVGQGANAAVSAAHTRGTVTLSNTTSAGAYAIAAFIDPTSCCGPVDPATALAAAQSVGFYTNDDDSISLAYNIGTLGRGQSATIGYAYTFSTVTPVPEPETYALMLAGLVPVVAAARRRRKQQTA